MAMIPLGQSFGLVLAHAHADTSIPKIDLFSSELQQPAFVEPSKAFANYYGRIHKEYDMETTHIEMLVTKLLQEMHPTLRAFVKHETMLRDNFMQRFFTSKTPLGEVFQEL
ncbi:MAG: hypothetical protein KR126chlam3_00497, partial [Chlamydiae bacterium]|nr:hypothetical protein [Chlamydiota bacterium]